jgi:hypothetical protein
VNTPLTLLTAAFNKKTREEKRKEVIYIRNQLYPEVKDLCIEVVRCFVRNPRVGPHWMAPGIRPTAEKGTFAYNCICAIENAVMEVGQFIESPEQRKKIRDMMLSSCIDGKKFIFEHWNAPFSKSNFYYKRDCFFYILARNLGLTFAQEFGNS